MTAPDVRTEVQEQRRKAFARLHLGASSLLVLAIVMMVNWLAFRHYERWDWTSQGMYTLSSRTEAELRALTTDLDVYLFMSETESNYPEVKELLDRYRAKSPRIRLEVVDADRDPGRYKVLAQRFQVGTAVDAESGQEFADVAVVVVSGERRWSVTRDDLVGLDVESIDDDEGPKVDVKAEQALTSAIVQVVSGKPTKVCVTEGHGEWSVSKGNEARSLWPLADELRRDNVELEAVRTLGVKEIPKDCNAVFVVGPVRAFSVDEADLLRAYVKAGGNLLLALDPNLEAEAVMPTGLEGIAAEWGISIDATVVLELDPKRLLPPGNPAGPFFLVDYGDHPTTEALKKLGAPCVGRLARSIRSTRDNVTVLVSTSKNAYAERSIHELAGQKEPTRGAGDVDGPVSVAVATVPVKVTPEGGAEGASSNKGGRVVVVGDTDWLSGELMRPDLANRDLLNAITGWLTAREALITIAPKKLKASRLALTEEDLGDLFWRLLVFIPAAFMVLGFSVAWSRRA